MTEIMQSEINRQYSLSDIQTIMFECSTACSLDSLVLKRIEELEKNLIIPLNDEVSSAANTSDYQYNGQRRTNNIAISSGSNEWIRKESTYDSKIATSYSSKRSGNGHPRSKNGQHSHDVLSKHRDSDLSMECWESIRNFKPTEFVASEGVSKIKNDLAAIFNKLSLKTFQDQKQNILDKIISILNPHIVASNSASDDILNELIQHIFTLSCANKMMGDIHAEIYIDLSSLSPVFKAVLLENIKKYCNSIHDINHIDPDSDYDGFCNYNKKNDNRKSIICFIIHLIIKNLIEKEHIFDILLEFMKIIDSFINTEKKVNEVDEITENIFLIVNLSYATIKSDSIWTNEVFPKIIEMSKRKTKEYKSLSSRAIFKYMDLIDFIKKQK